MPTVLITPEPLVHREGRHLSLLGEAGFEVRYPENLDVGRGLTDEDETVKELSVCQAVIAGADVLTAGVMDRLPQLRVIARAGVGYDRVDVAAATERGIPVTITPTTNHEGVAEHALALMFAVAKSVVAGDRAVRAGRWPRTPTEPLRTRTLGILGLGRIGRSIAVRALALGMKVIATETFPNEEFVSGHGIRLVPFEALLAESDYLTIHCPLNDETRGLFGKETLAKMKPGGVLINTARGPLVVESDLAEALRSGHLGGAGLDVFEEEPTAKDNPLFGIENVVMTPHSAGADHLSRDGMAREAAECIIKLHQGDWPEGTVVNDQLREGWKW